MRLSDNFYKVPRSRSEAAAEPPTSPLSMGSCTRGLTPSFWPAQRCVFHKSSKSQVKLLCKVLTMVVRDAWFPPDGPVVGDSQESPPSARWTTPCVHVELEDETHATSGCSACRYWLPVQVYEVIGTAVAKTLSGSLELILKNKSNKTAAGTALESGATERCLQSFVGVLCALCPCPSGDSRDTSSTSEAGRRLGDVCIVALPVLCPGLRRFQEVGNSPC